MLKVGTPALDFVGVSNQGKIHLKDYIGKKIVILIFIPKGGGQDCLEQLKELETAYEEFVRNDTIILGCYGDFFDSNPGFIKENDFSFPFISDPDLKISKTYNVLEKEEKCNVTVYVIDFDGVICYVKERIPTKVELMGVIDKFY